MLGVLNHACKSGHWVYIQSVIQYTNVEHYCSSYSAVIHRGCSVIRGTNCTHSSGFSHKRYTFWFVQSSDRRSRVERSKFHNKRAITIRISKYARLCFQQSLACNLHSTNGSGLLTFDLRSSLDPQRMAEMLPCYR